MSGNFFVSALSNTAAVSPPTVADLAFDPFLDVSAPATLPLACVDDFLPLDPETVTAAAAAIVAAVMNQSLSCSNSTVSSASTGSCLSTAATTPAGEFSTPDFGLSPCTVSTLPATTAATFLSMPVYSDALSYSQSAAAAAVAAAAMMDGYGAAATSAFDSTTAAAAAAASGSLMGMTTASSGSDRHPGSVTAMMAMPGRYVTTAHPISSTAHTAHSAHPMALHPPLHIASTGTTPYGFGGAPVSAVAAMAATAAGFSTGLVASAGSSNVSTPAAAAAAASGYFNGWPLQWPTGGTGVTTVGGPSAAGGHLSGLMHSTTAGWTAAAAAAAAMSQPPRQQRLTTTLWEDESTVCYQVDVDSVCVARRQDNNMINGTKLLNVVGMTRGKRDGILKNEKQRVVVKVGAMHLKGVWIPFERAKALAEQHGILEKLYPLFAEDPNAHLLQHPPMLSGSVSSASATAAAVAAAAAAAGRLRTVGDSLPTLHGYDLSMLSADRRATPGAFVSATYSPPALSPDSLGRRQLYGGYAGDGTDVGSTVMHATSASLMGAADPSTTGGANTWSPLTPSMDARTYYGTDSSSAAAVAAAAAAAVAVNGVGYDMPSSSRAHHPTSPSAIVYSTSGSNSKKRNSDYMTAIEDIDAATSSTYDMTTAAAALHLNAARMSHTTTSSAAAAAGYSSGMPLSPATSPALATFDAASAMERTYSEVEERPARKRSRIGLDLVGDGSEHHQPPTPTAAGHELPVVSATHIHAHAQHHQQQHHHHHLPPPSSAHHLFKSLPALHEHSSAASAGILEDTLPGLDISGQRSAGFTVGDSAASSFLLAGTNNSQSLLHAAVTVAAAAAATSVSDDHGEDDESTMYSAVDFNSGNHHHYGHYNHIINCDDTEEEGEEAEEAHATVGAASMLALFPNSHVGIVEDTPTAMAAATAAAVAAAVQGGW